ncbi:MAG: secondary thiamine-phosphate synthase enzyme YjbQ [Candidatus Omnitrophota bacterium]|nr:secondary thiamine-phosphate synthase enzyme YjbQ [Candidatus Omnitrophota bacterium]
MKIINQRLTFNTKGNLDLINITRRLEEVVNGTKLNKGMLTVFVVGSTAGITTFEFEPGLIKDIDELYERIIPRNKHYHHDQTWGDANGFSHLRAALTGPALSIPFEKGRLLLGTWQQVVLAEFDNRPRQRQVIAQIIGE